MTCCPSCGFNLTRDEIVEIDGWRIDPRGIAEYDGRAIHFAPAQLIILHSIAMMRGRIAARDAILNRMGTEAEPNILSVLVCRIRRTINAAGIPSPIKTVCGRGYRWELPA